MMTERTYRVLEEMARQIQSPETAKLPRDLQKQQLLIWAIRWRMLLQEAGKENADDREMRRVARLLHTMRARLAGLKESPYVPGLNPAEVRDWSKELAEAEKKYAETVQRHRLYAETRGRLAELERFLAQGDPKSDEEERRLHHLIRDCARYESLRGELVDMLEPYREILPPEFGFLWEKPATAVEVGARAHLSNYDVMCRILRRLIQKDIIGARYCPIEMVTLGFDGSDRGRAKEAVELLIHHGVLLAAKGGTTVSVAPKWVTQVRKFLDGEPMGNMEVDEWAAA